MWWGRCPSLFSPLTAWVSLCATSRRPYCSTQEVTEGNNIPAHLGEKYRRCCAARQHENRALSMSLSYCGGFTVMALLIILVRQQSPQLLPWVQTCQLHCSSSFHLDHRSMRNWPRRHPQSCLSAFMKHKKDKLEVIGFARRLQSVRRTENFMFFKLDFTGASLKTALWI